MSEPLSEYSHPDRPVRHSYPLAVADAGLGTAIGLMTRTMPYALARFGILFTVSIVSIIWMIITFGGFAFLGSKIHPIAGWAWFLTGAGIYGYLWRTLIRYALYLLKAGHIAVLTELITRGSVGAGNEGMFEYGKKVVTQRFGQVNVMFALDLLVNGVVRAFNRTLNWIANLLPIPGLSSITAIVNAIVYSATTFIDETIFSYALARGDSDNFRASRDGLIYYAQNAKEVLKTGVWIVVLDKIASGIAWVAMLIPAYLIAFMLPASMVGWGFFGTWVMAAIFASSLRSAFLQPLFLTMIMVKFHVSVREQAIDLTWDERLTSLSDKFVELKKQITGEGARAPAPAQIAG